MVVTCGGWRTVWGNLMVSGVPPRNWLGMFIGGVGPRLIEQRYLGIARYEKATAVKEKGRNISRGAAPNVTVLLEK